MIHKNIKYGNIENVIVAEFGKGSLSVTSGDNEDHLSLLIKTVSPGPIGAVGEPTNNSDDFRPELALVFTNKESFDVFYDYVKIIKKDFMKKIKQ